MTNHQWYQKELPFIVRINNAMDNGINLSTSLFQDAIDDFKEEYQPDYTSLLTSIRDKLSHYIEHNNLDIENIGIMNHYISSFVNRRDDSDVQAVFKKCPNFASHIDILNEELNTLGVDIVPSFDPIPPPKTRSDLKTERGREYYDVLQTIIESIAQTRPNEAMMFIMNQYGLLDNEDLYFNEDGTPFKMSSRDREYVGDDLFGKVKTDMYFDDYVFTDSDSDSD